MSNILQSILRIKFHLNNFEIPKNYIIGYLYSHHDNGDQNYLRKSNKITDENLHFLMSIVDGSENRKDSLYSRYKKKYMLYSHYNRLSLLSKFATF